MVGNPGPMKVNKTRSALWELFSGWGSSRDNKQLTKIGAILYSDKHCGEISCKRLRSVCGAVILNRVVRIGLTEPMYLGKYLEKMILALGIPG